MIILEPLANLVMRFICYLDGGLILFVFIVEIVSNSNLYFVKHYMENKKNVIFG